MTEPTEQLPQKLPETEQDKTPEDFSLPQAWPNSGQQLPGGVQLGFPGFPSAVVSLQQTHWQGQFPPPDAIERYEAVQSGAFDRIITMAEKQQDAAIARGKEADQYRHADVKRAHYLGAAVTSAALVCSLIAYHMGSAILGGAFLSVPVLSVGKAILDSVRPREAVKVRPETEAVSEQKKLRGE